MKLSYLLLLIVALGVLVSCGDDDPEEIIEIFDYSVAIMSPDNTDRVVGDSIHIHVNFEEVTNKTIHNVSVEITDELGQEIYLFSEHVHEESGHYEHHADFVLAVDSGSNLTLTASIWPHEDGEHMHGSHNDSEKTKSEVSFEVN